MQYDPNLLRHMDARALAAVHEAAGAPRRPGACIS